MVDSLLANRPFLNFLSTQNEELVQQLYESRHSVVAIYRMLPSIGQQCLLQMIFRKNSDWRSWTNPRNQMLLHNCLQFLSKLRILEGDLDAELQINLDFKMNFISSILTSVSDLGAFRPHPLDEKSQKAANKDLMGKSVERWESILCYLAIPSDSAEKGVSETSRSLFDYIGLVKGRAKEQEISSSGFQFLLLSRSEQIWTYLTHYFNYMASKGEDILPLMEFFLRLMLCIQRNESQIHPLVSEQTWPEAIHAFMMTLREIGLIFVRKRKDGWFLLTPLMTQIAQEACGQSENGNELDGVDKAKSGGFLIVETNYRVYAYTNSTLQLAILSTFADILYRFQNIAICLLSRDSVRRALQTGITARQISQYLRANAHQQMQSTSQDSSAPIIPVTVIDQIFLWEQERKRFTCVEGILYSAFDSESDFVAFRDFALQNKCSPWHCNIQKMVIVDLEWDERAKNWLNERKGTGGGTAGRR